MPLNQTDRKRVELLRKQTARLIGVTRRAIHETRETVQRCRRHREEEMEAAAVLSDHAPADHQDHH